MAVEINSISEVGNVVTSLVSLDPEVESKITEMRTAGYHVRTQDAEDGQIELSIFHAPTNTTKHKALVDGDELTDALNSLVEFEIPAEEDVEHMSQSEVIDSSAEAHVANDPVQQEQPQEPVDEAEEPEAPATPVADEAPEASETDTNDQNADGHDDQTGEFVEGNQEGAK